MFLMRSRDMLASLESQPTPAEMYRPSLHVGLSCHMLCVAREPVLGAPRATRHLAQWHYMYAGDRADPYGYAQVIRTAHEAVCGLR